MRIERFVEVYKTWSHATARDIHVREEEAIAQMEYSMRACVSG
jgi:hypothetical protein